MKKSTPGGQVIIISQPAFYRRRRHDRWPLHAVGTPYTEAGQTVSGVYNCDFVCNLKDEKTYVYVAIGFNSTTETNDWQQGYRTYTTSDGVTGFFGEYFNYVQRPRFTMKFTQDEYNFWAS